MIGAADAPTLLAVAHGSSAPAADQTVDQLFVEVRRQRPGLAVAAAYLDHSTPLLSEALRTMGGPTVVVPLLLTAAFHSDVDLPAQLAASPVPVAPADPLGPHPLLLRGLERRLAEAGVVAGDPRTAVVLAAAGSTSPAAVESVATLARGWAAAGWRAVEPAYASATGPDVETAIAGLRAGGASAVAVASYLLFPGLFADRVAHSSADATSAPLGAAPEVAAVVLQRYDEARARMPALGRR